MKLDYGVVWYLLRVATFRFLERLGDQIEEVQEERWSASALVEENGTDQSHCRSSIFRLPGTSTPPILLLKTRPRKDYIPTKANEFKDCRQSTNQLRAQAAMQDLDNLPISIYSHIIANPSCLKVI